jgi:hypothetical protein
MSSAAHTASPSQHNKPAGIYHNLVYSIDQNQSTVWSDRMDSESGWMLEVHDVDGKSRSNKRKGGGEKRGGRQTV